MEGFDSLGTTERFAAERLRNAVVDCGVSLTKLNELFDKLSDVDYESVFLDSKRKDLAVTIIGHMQKLATNLRSSELLAEVALIERAK